MSKHPPPDDTPDPDDLVLAFQYRDGRPARIRPIAPGAVTVGPASDPPPVVVGPLPESAKPKHSPDFASVRWGGVVYGFGGQQQRDIVAALWAAWQSGTPWMTQEALLEEACSKSARLDDVFKNHPAWQTMIVRGRQAGGPVGTFCLNIHALGA